MDQPIKLYFPTQSSKIHQLRGIGVYTDQLLSFLKKSSQINLVSGPASADLIHLSSWPLFQLSPKINLKKTIITVHDLIPLALPKLFPLGYKAKLIWPIQRYRLTQAKNIITDSKASKLQLIKFAGLTPDKITIIPLAPRPIFSTKPSTSTLNQNKKKFSLPGKFALYVGDLNPNKNIRSVVTACLSQNLPLVIVGKAATSKPINPQHPELKDLIWLQDQVRKNPQKIILTGPVSDSQLLAIYHQAKLYLHPSLAEGFGLPVLEALACGLPVITSNCFSLPEVAGRAAILVNPTNQVEINQAVKKVLGLTSSDLQTMAKQAIIQANKYSWGKTVSQTIKIYQQCLS